MPLALPLDDPAAADRLAIPFADAAAVDGSHHLPPRPPRKELTVRQPDYTRRVVVTGLGVISPVGNDKDDRLEQPVNGVSGLREITKFDTPATATSGPARSSDFEATEWMDAKAVRRSEPAMWYGVAAAKQAIADAGLEITDANREDIGVVFGTGAGGQTLMIENWEVLKEKGPNRVAPTFIANGLVDSTSRDDRHRDRAPSATTSAW